MNDISPDRIRHAGVRLAVVTLLLAAALSGCGNDNPVKPQPMGPKYLPSSTPQNVLANLQAAYSTRDSTGYDSLFDADYTGTSFDPGTMVVLHFTRADEARHIAALAQTPSITVVSLSLPPLLARTTDATDPPGWATITAGLVALEITDGATTYRLPNNVTMEFKFKPATPSPASPTDTTWHIAGWTEFIN